jgi:nicotinamidase-related amidase
VSELPPIDSPETFPGWHSPWPSFEVDWQRAALVVIDLQNYGCNPGVGLMAMLTDRYPEIARYYLPRVSETVVPNARRLLDGFRAAGRRIVHTRHGALLADGSDMIARRRRRDVDALAMTGTPALWHRGTFEHEIVEELAPLTGELVIDKNTSSPFNSTGIESLLRNMELETLVLVGMATDMCVETTARDAADRGFNVIVVEDATATFFERHHRAALSGFARVFGQVWETARVLDALGGPTQAPAPRRSNGRRSIASAPRRR